MNLLWKTLLDLKEPAILFRLFIPFIVGFILVLLLGYGLFGILFTSDLITQSPILLDFQYWIQQAEFTIVALPIIGGILFVLLEIVVVMIAGIIGIILGSYLVLLFAMIITAFMTDTLIKAVHDKHYPDLEYKGHGSTVGMLWSVTKVGLLVLLLFIVTLPLLFIPLINIIWFWMLGFLFFRYTLVLDVGQVILTKQLFNKLKGLTNWEPTSALAILLLLSIFPLMGFFAPILAVIALSHYYFGQLALEQMPVDLNNESNNKTIYLPNK